LLYLDFFLNGVFSLHELTKPLKKIMNEYV